MKNYKLLNDYTYLTEFEYINTKDLDGTIVESYIEEIVIDNFYNLVRHCLGTIRQQDKLTYIDIDFDNLYSEVVNTVKYNYNLEVDEIFVDEIFIEDLQSLIKEYIY